MKKYRTNQKGFVLAISMIFLLVMTGLAITAIRRSTLDEKVAGNLREQNLAFQAAETALRYCENIVETEDPVVTITLRDIGGTVLPNEWDTPANWGAGGFATTLPAGTVANVATQPQCMAERWQLQKNETFAKNAPVGLVHVITARGVGSTPNSVVWLQVTTRTGS